MIFNLGTAKSNGFDVNLQALLGEHVKFNTMIGHTVGVAAGALSLVLFGLWNSPM